MKNIIKKGKVDRLVRNEHIKIDTKIKKIYEPPWLCPSARGKQKIIIKAIDIVNTFVL